MTNPDCLFCRIATKAIPAKIIYEDENAIAFLDITPRAPGHTLVIPKYHAPTLLDLPDKIVGSFFEAVKRTDGMLAKKLSPDGMTIGINQGTASGQEVGHLHVHLMPRWHNDGGGSVQSVMKNAPKESVEEMFERIIS